MAFTKVVGPGIHTLAQLRTHNIHSAGIITATRFVGEIGAGTGNTSTFTNVNITGNLTVQGDTTTLNTTLRNVELLRVASNSTTTAGIITQTGTGDILNLFDGTSEVLTVLDGGNVGIGLTNPGTKLEIKGTAATLFRLDSSNAQGTTFRIRNSGTDKMYMGLAADFIVGQSSNVTDSAIRASGALLFASGGGTERLRIDSSGRLSTGAGISSEVAAGGMHIYQSSAGNNLVSLILENNGSTTNTSTELKFVPSDASPNDRYNSIRVLDIDGNNKFDTTFFTCSGGTPTEKLRITHTGHIVTQGLNSYSFNNDSANCKILEVTGDGSVGEYGILNLSGNQNADDGTIGIIKFVNRENSNSSSGANAGSKQIGSLEMRADTGDTNAGDDCGGYFRFITKADGGGNSERVRITSAGRVLIGDGAATSLLSVGGTNYNWDQGDIPMVLIKGHNNESPTSGTNNIAFQIEDENNNLIHRVWNTGGGNSDVGKVYYAGKVGINSTSPTAYFEIGAHNTATQTIRVRNHTSAGNFANNYGSEFRHVFNSMNHGMLIHTQEAADARRTLDISDSNGIFATFTNHKVGIGTVVPDQTLELWKKTGTNLLKVSSEANSTIGIEIEKTGSTTQSWRIADGQTVNGSLEFHDVTDDKRAIGIDGSRRVIIGPGNHAGGSQLVIKGGDINAYSTLGMFSEHTNPSADTLLSQIRFGSNATAIGADIRVHADAAWGTNDYPTRMSFYTTDDGTNTRDERLRISNNGHIKFATNNSTTDNLLYGSNPRLWLKCPDGINGLRIDSNTTPLEIRTTDANGRSIGVGGSPNFDMSLSGDYSLSANGYDSSPKIFLNATRHNGSSTVTSFQTSIQAVATSNTNNTGYLGLGSSAAADDLCIDTSGDIRVTSGKLGVNVALNETLPAALTVRNGGIYLEQGNTITWNNGDNYIKGESGYHLLFQTYDGSSSCTDKLRIRGGSGVTNTKIQLPQASGGFYHSHNSAAITPANNDWVYFGYVPYGSGKRGQFVVEWASLSAPSCCYHGYAILEAGSSHGPDYDYVHSESLELIAYDSHGAHNFKAWKLVDSSSSGGSHLKIFGQWSGSTVQSGTFHMTVLPCKTMLGGTIQGANPAVDNNSYNGTRLTIDGRFQRGSTGFEPQQMRLNKSMFGIFHASSGLDTAGAVSTRGSAAGADGTLWCHYGGLSATRNGYTVGSYTPFAGMVAPNGAGARYLHVKFNITAGAMWLIDIKGYEYNGLWTSEVQGSSVSSDHVLHAIAGGYHYNNDALFNGKSAAYRGANPGWYLNNNYVCCWIDTNNTGTTNRWGFYKFEGGTDGIIGISQQKPACVLAYTYSTGTADAF